MRNAGHALATLLALLAAPATCRRCSLKEIQPVEVAGDFREFVELLCVELHSGIILAQ